MVENWLKSQTFRLKKKKSGSMNVTSRNAILFPKKKKKKKTNTKNITTVSELNRVTIVEAHLTL